MIINEREKTVKTEKFYFLTLWLSLINGVKVLTCPALEEFVGWRKGDGLVLSGG